MLLRMRTAQCVIYNRLAKTGSTTTDVIIKQTAARNGVHVMRSNVHRRRALKSQDMADLNNRLQNSTKPWVYIRHIYFLDTLHLTPAPVYINTVRDPIERMNSEFYWQRLSTENTKAHWTRHGTWNMSFDDCVQRYWPDNSDKCFLWNMRSYTIQFFCGQDEMCGNAALDILSQCVKKSVGEA